jgi:hypothetical protein
MAILQSLAIPGFGLGLDSVEAKAERVRTEGERLCGTLFNQTFQSPHISPVPQLKNLPHSSLPFQVRPLINAGGLYAAGLLLHELPARSVPGRRWLLPTDPKVWGRVFLGIGAIHQINKAFDWQPPPWLAGLEAVAVITPLVMRFKAGTLKQVALLAPVVAGVVQLASELNKRITDPLQERANIPPVVTRLAIATALALGGMKVSKLLGMGGAAAMTCARGCTPGSLVCLSEVGEMVSGMKSWFQKEDTQSKPERR